MRFRKICLLLLLVLIFILSCQQAKESDKENNKLNVIATIFPVYDFARIIGGDKINAKMLLPPGIDVHHYELRPEDIAKVSKADIFLFTNFELEQWAYKIIKAADKNTNMLAIETGSGTVLMPLNKEPAEKDDHENHKENISRFDPHIWLDMDNAQKMVDNITDAFIKKDSRNSDDYRKNAADLKRKLMALDQQYRTELTGCKTKIILHAGHSAFAYLARRYNLQYIAVYNVFADAEPSPQLVFNVIEQIKNEKVPYVYYEDMANPRLAETIARETGVGLLKLNNGHDIRKKDLDKGESFVSIMENNLINLKKGMKCPQK
ncbi:MAG: zinc ABC transporter substrate-binding protein [Smithella sp.]|jgi:zinc transport system substrate-binding protein